MEKIIRNYLSKGKNSKFVIHNYNLCNKKCGHPYVNNILSKVILLLICLFFSSTTIKAKSHITETKYDIEGIETGRQGTYLVKVYVYSGKKSISIEEFKYAAVHGVIFRGFSGKSFVSQKPLVKSEAQIRNADYFNDFFNNGDYATYAEVINPATDRVKIGKEYKIAAIVLVSKDNLRKALENANVIRSLNSDF